MRPDVVITFTDNDVFFQKLSRAYLSARFIAIQNGVRAEGFVTNQSQRPHGLLPTPPAWGWKIELPVFYCFGQHEIDIFNRFGHDVQEFRPFGSLLGGYFKTDFRPSPGPITDEAFDIVFPSQWRLTIAQEIVYPELWKSQKATVRHLANYARIRKLKVGVALVADPSSSTFQMESDFFHEYLKGANYKLIPKNRRQLSVYQLMDQARVVLHNNSASGYEAFGWGKKVFFVNYTGLAYHSALQQGFWSLSVEDQSLFDQKLDDLFAMDESEYLRVTAPARKYVMSFDPSRPLHRVLREDVLHALAKKT